MYVHALHTVHALPDLRFAGGRLGDGVSSKRTPMCSCNFDAKIPGANSATEPHLRRRHVDLRERLPNEFFAFLPECLGIIWIQRVSSDAFAPDVERHVVRNNVADVAVLAISAADLVCGRNNCSPHGSGSPLWNGLQLIRLFTCGSTLLVCLVQHLLKETLVHVATQFSPYAPRMDRCSAHATVAVPFVERNGEESVGSL